MRYAFATVKWWTVLTPVSYTHLDVYKRQVIFSALIFYHQLFTFREIGVVYSMTLLIPTALGTLVGLRALGGNHGMFYVIIAIFSAWIADVGAFFAGSFFGKRKLCPQISPKKTVEGLVGGVLLDVIAMLVFGYVFQALLYSYEVRVSYLSLLVIGLVGSALSVIGDLAFSLIKRSCHIKDFSEIIPGPVSYTHLKGGASACNYYRPPGDPDSVFACLCGSGRTGRHGP